MKLSDRPRAVKPLGMTMDRGVNAGPAEAIRSLWAHAGGVAVLMEIS